MCVKTIVLINQTSGGQIWGFDLLNDLWMLYNNEYLKIVLKKSYRNQFRSSVSSLKSSS